MTIVTPCGIQPNDSDCMMCLRMAECKEAREQICWGRKREFLCPSEFKHKRAAEGYCRGRKMI